MATVLWTGGSVTRPQIDTLTVGSSAAGQTFAVAINGKTITYTAGGSETAATVAAALLALLQASPEGEFRELTWTGSGPAVVATGPAAGTPFTLAVSGTGTFTRAATQTALSPYDASVPANYLSGSLPAAGDALVFEGAAPPVLYGLSALAAVALASVVRRGSYPGPIGLPPQAAGGYREYRPRHLSVSSAAVLVEQPGGDGAGQVRLLCTASAAVTLTAVGDRGTAPVGGEALEATGLPAGSTVDCSGGSVAVAPLAGQTAAVATLRASDATVTVGAGVTLGAAVLTGCQARVDCGYASLAVDGGTVTATGSAGGATTVVDAGTLAWRSAGSPGDVSVGGGGAADFAGSPGPVAVGSVAMAAGGRWNDPAGRVATPYSLQLLRCGVGEVQVDVGVGKQMTLAVG